MPDEAPVTSATLPASRGFAMRATLPAARASPVSPAGLAGGFPRADAAPL